MSYTTKLLTDRLDQALPPRHRLILAGVVAWVALGAIVGSLGSHRATPAPLPAILIVATPTIHPIAGRANPPERSEPAPSATPEPATPEPVVIVQTVEVPVAVYVERAAPAVEPAQEAAPEPTPTYSDFYTNIPGASPELLAACAKEPARSQSWICNSARP